MRLRTTGKLGREPNAAVDACPGALRVHAAADGGLARIRLPGGRVSAAQWHTLARVATEHGDGTIELTSRANVQLRGLGTGAFATELAAVGLLPSATHERVRNILGSPLSDHITDLVAEFDAALCAEPRLAELPGRFMFAFDGGSGDVAGLGADLAAYRLAADRFAIFFGGLDAGVRVPPPSVVPTLIAAAHAFLDVRTEGVWRLAELPSSSAVTARFPATAERMAVGAPRRVPVGVHGDRLVAGVPLGRLVVKNVTFDDEIVVTPWRSLVLPRSAQVDGLIVDPSLPLANVSACTGRPGCAKALADVRADALAAPATGDGRPVHWSGCSRRCGHPAGDYVDVLATPDGYLVDGHAADGPAR